MSLILAAILFQAPYKPEPVKFPESKIVIERFMLKGDDIEVNDPVRKEIGEIYL